jgi:hypothetical protein
MGLSQIQQTLAKIYTSSAFREEFFDSSQWGDRELGLTEEEIEQLTKISSQRVNLFAASLKQKRLGQIRKLLPLTSKCLGKDLYQLFWEYSETFIPGGIKKHPQDAIEFANFLEKKLDCSTRTNVGDWLRQRAKLDRDWILDVIRYERSWLTMAISDRLFLGCRFNNAIAPLIESLQKSENEPAKIKKSTFTIWFRLSSKSKVYHWKF